MLASLRRFIVLAGLLLVAGSAHAAAPYYVRVAGTPSPINCSATTFFLGAGATMSWSFVNGSASTVDATAYVNGGSVGTQSFAFPQQTGSVGLEAINAQSISYAAQTIPYSLSVEIVPQDPATDGVRISFTCTAAGGTNFSATVIPAPEAKLQASPASLSFPPTSVGATSAPLVATISNTGNADATGVTVSSSNTAEFTLIANTCGATIAQGASCTISATFKPTSAGPRGATVTVNRAGGDGTSFGMNGTGTAQLSIPLQLGFSSQAVGTVSAPQTLTVTNSSATPVTVSSVTSSNPTEFPATTNCAVVPPSGTCSITITFHPTATGTRNATVTVTSDGIGSPQSITVSGTGTGGTASGQLLLPGSLSFGMQTVGITSAPTLVTVSNTGGAAVAVSSIASSVPSEFAVSGNTCATVNPGAQCTFSVAFTPSAAGTRAATITVTSNGAGSPQLISASGTGTTAPTPGQLSMTSTLTFGTQTVGAAGSPTVVTVTNTGGSAVNVSGVASSAPSEFAVSANTCATVNAGAQCTFNVTFTPAAAGARAATITVTSNGVGSPQAISASGTGSAVPTPGQLAVPTTVDAGSVMIGTTSAPDTVTIANIGGAPVQVSGIASSNPGEFAIAQSNCGTVAAGATCSFNFTFAPIATGPRSTTITVTSNGVGSPQNFGLSGTGVTTPPLPPATVDVIEYYHAEWDHYFITAIPDEITKLDNGVFKGWARTGYKFKAYPPNAANSANVCRFFSTSFGERSSHFYTPFITECEKVKANHDWMLESSEVFSIPIPSLSGACPAGTVPVYRYYNNGQGGAPNHRYSIELSLRADMIQVRGWIPEGYGDLGVIMCAPV